MNLITNIPSQQYGYWLPVYGQTKVEHYIVRRMVLREFKYFIQDMRQKWNLGKVKNFQWLVKGADEACQFRPEFCATYGWKCEFIEAKIEVIK